MMSFYNSSICIVVGSNKRNQKLGNKIHTTNILKNYLKYAKLNITFHKYIQSKTS